MDLLRLMSDGVRELTIDALKICIGKPAASRQLRLFLARQKKAEELRDEHSINGCPMPPFLIASITQDCNLFCKGCYAHANQGGCSSRPMLDAQRWGEILQEAASLGVCFILLAGGEPLLRMDVLQKASNVREIMFPVFTNGLLINEKMADFFDQNRNLLPVLSLEGGVLSTDARRGAGVYDRVLASMSLLKKRRILFGASITFTKENIGEITDLKFVRSLKRLGSSIAFFVEYVPSDGVSAHLAPDDAARALFNEKLAVMRKKVRMMVLSFPGDEDFTEGCLAAGRGFVHINASGGLEPCPFSPYSDTNAAEVGLEKAMASPFLSAIREENMLHGEHKGGCLLYEKRELVEGLLSK